LSHAAGRAGADNATLILSGRSLVAVPDATGIAIIAWPGPGVLAVAIFLGAWLIVSDTIGISAFSAARNGAVTRSSGPQKRAAVGQS
jgi:hypothetical protein